MSKNNCRIGKVTLKKGGNLHIFPNEKRNYKTYDLGWGEISFRVYDTETISRETMVYMLRCAEKLIIER